MQITGNAAEFVTGEQGKKCLLDRAYLKFCYTISGDRPLGAVRWSVMVSLNRPQIGRNAHREERGFDWLYETGKKKRKSILKSGDRRFQLIRRSTKEEGKYLGRG